MSFHSALVFHLLCCSPFPQQSEFGNHVFRDKQILPDLDPQVPRGHPEHCWESEMKFLEVPASREDKGSDLDFTLPSIYWPTKTFLCLVSMLNTTSETGKVNSDGPGPHDFTSESSQTLKEHQILMLNNLFKGTKSNRKQPQTLTPNKYRTRGDRMSPT